MAHFIGYDSLTAASPEADNKISNIDEELIRMNVIQKRALLLDNAVILSGMTISSLARNALEVNYRLDFAHFLDAIFTGLVFSISLYSNGCYEIRNLASGADETKRIIKAGTNSLLIIGTLSYVFKHDPNRFVLLIGYLVGVILILSGRKLLNNQLIEARANGKYMRKALILGSPKFADETTSTLRQNPRFGLNAIGRQEIHNELSYTSQRAWLTAIDQAIDDSGVEVLIIEDSQETNQKLLNLLSWHVNKRNVDVLIAMSFIDALGPRLTLNIHHELPLMYLDEPKLSPASRFVKRWFDIIIAGVATLIFLPLLLILYVGVVIADGFPVIFTQPRIGLAGREFKFLKFRTMIVGAADMRDDVLGTPDEDMADRYKADPRIYPFGKFLRRFSLDELPQLLSVIKGDMSLVGPRPLLPEELDLLGDEDHRRHLAKPGLTGLWQVSGRKETTWEERMQMDLHYVHNWSVGLDLAILLRTIKVVATGHGSY